MTREEVYRLIDGEREYQALVEADPTRCAQDERPHSTGEYLVMLKAYIDRAMEKWVSTSDDDPAQPVTDIVRKIAGIAVHCMEDHGAPPRTMPPPKLRCCEADRIPVTKEMIEKHIFQKWAGLFKRLAQGDKDHG